MDDMNVVLCGCCSQSLVLGPDGTATCECGARVTEGPWARSLRAVGPSTSYEDYLRRVREQDYT